VFPRQRVRLSLLSVVSSKLRSVPALMMSNHRFMDLHGYRVAYRDAGPVHGEPVVLIHGMVASSLTWDPVVARLTSNYRVIAPDLLGHGESDKPRTDYSLGAFAVWLRDFLDALDIPAATLVGHSLGGGVAMQFVHQHRPRCKRLILVNSGGLGRDVGVMLRVLSAPGTELVLPILASPPFRLLGSRLRSMLTARGVDPQQLEYRLRKYTSLADPDARQAFLRTLRSVVDVRGQNVCALSRLPHLVGDVPTLIIAGAQDNVIPPAHAHAAHAALPASQLRIIEDAGHFPHLERPDTLAALIHEFVSAQRSRIPRVPNGAVVQAM
jgi:pimeloyl-ACP methyl ester carboxylesterase